MKFEWSDTVPIEVGDVAKLQQAGIQLTADLIYTSGSNLDPHITPEATRAQITRTAQAHLKARIRELAGDRPSR
ncbi:MAG: potassium-transporting ATPase subunit C [Thermosynechococcaceae cyanobacterium]